PRALPAAPGARRERSVGGPDARMGDHLAAAAPQLHLAAADSILRAPRGRARTTRGRVMRRAALVLGAWGLWLGAWAVTLAIWGEALVPLLALGGAAVATALLAGCLVFKPPAVDPDRTLSDASAAPPLI